MPRAPPMLLLLLLLAVAVAAEGRALQLRTSAARRTGDAPPPTMLHLYQRYRKGRAPFGAANTVRSFYATPGRLGDADVLVFNVTGVQPSEYVERAELHLRAPGPDPTEVLDLSRPARPRVALVPASPGGPLDVTDGVIACLDGGGTGGRPALVGVAGGAAPPPADALLVLFSEDDDHLALRELRGRSQAPPGEELDNELPGYAADAGAEVVQARNKHLSLAPSPPRRPKKHRRRRRGGGGRLPRPWARGWWSGGGPGDDDDDAAPGVRPRSVCQRRRTVVGVAELGWGDWVIAPKAIDASYCAGACPRALADTASSPNHASVRALVRALGLRPGVPEPCCAPTAAAPLVLLYYDAHGNVVLKRLPDASVERCSCR